MNLVRKLINCAKFYNHLLERGFVSRAVTSAITGAGALGAYSVYEKYQQERPIYVSDIFQRIVLLGAMSVTFTCYYQLKRVTWLLLRGIINFRSLIISEKYKPFVVPHAIDILLLFWGPPLWYRYYDETEIDYLEWKFWNVVFINAFLPFHWKSVYVFPWVAEHLEYAFELIGAYFLLKRR